MVLNPFEWGVIVAIAGLVVAIIGFFVKRTLHAMEKRVDAHDTDLQGIKGDYVTKTELDANNESIHEVKRTFVTKEELKELKADLRSETKALATDVKEIKDNYIRKDDFHRSMQGVNNSLDQLRDLIIKMMGGSENGPKR
ncbi:MAG: hypothetical protein ACK5LX_13900 [Oscillospiraceae bacterium]